MPGVGVGIGFIVIPADAVVAGVVGALLLEDGSYLLLEDGSKLLLG